MLKFGNKMQGESREKREILKLHSTHPYYEHMFLYVALCPIIIKVLFSSKWGQLFQKRRWWDLSYTDYHSNSVSWTLWSSSKKDYTYVLLRDALFSMDMFKLRNNQFTLQMIPRGPKEEISLFGIYLDRANCVLVSCLISVCINV